MRAYDSEKMNEWILRIDIELLQLEDQVMGIYVSLMNKIKKKTYMIRKLAYLNLNKNKVSFLWFCENGSLWFEKVAERYSR